jgi:hypothetical protein
LVREFRHITDYRTSNTVKTQPRFEAGSCLVVSSIVIDGSDAKERNVLSVQHFAQKLHLPHKLKGLG